MNQIILDELKTIGITLEEGSYYMNVNGDKTILPYNNVSVEIFNILLRLYDMTFREVVISPTRTDIELLIPISKDFKLIEYIPSEALESPFSMRVVDKIIKILEFQELLD